MPATWSHMTQSPGHGLQTGGLLAAGGGGADPTPGDGHKLHLLFSCISLVLNKSGTAPPLGIFREYFGNKGTVLIVMMTKCPPGNEGWRPRLLNVLISCNIYRKMKNCLCFSTVPQDTHIDANCVYLEPVSGLRIKYSIFVEFSRNVTTI